MNLYLEPPGFLGTGASLLADLTLIFYILLIAPAMLIGFWLARRGRHRPAHRNLMIAVTAINWVLIIFLMLVAYRFDVAGNFPNQPTAPRYLLPVLHALLGLPAQLLATYIVVRMLIEDVRVAQGKRRGEPVTQLRRYWFKQAKPAMQITLGLWLATAALGVITYLVRYEVLPGSASGEAAPPVATPEVQPPVGTAEVVPPVETPEVQPPVATPELDEDAAEDAIRAAERSARDATRTAEEAAEDATRAAEDHD
ncbi:MAG: hypothetical protein IPO91_05940 [Chloroflexi bacterium]|nr:hypothetical protein [Chloroflexota bacterium]